MKNRSTRYPALLITLATLLFLAQPFFGQTERPDETEQNAYAALDLVQLADALENQIHAVRSNVPQERAVGQELLAELSERKVPDYPSERADMARAWKAAAVVIRETEGATPFHATALEIAAELDPEDEWLAKELAFQKRRQEILQARAERAAKARADGHDPEPRQ